MHFMPHGHCYLWDPGLVWTNVISDALIGLAYLSISLSLYLLIRKIQIPFSAVIVAFGVFIAACGLTHFVEVWNLWSADYWFAGGVKIVTAIASVATAVWLYPLTPKILAFAHAVKVSDQRGVELEAAYEEMEHRVQERTADLQTSHQREVELRKQIEALYADAQKANELKDQFLATMSHELRTPLSVILGYSDMLITDNLSAQEVRQALQAIQRNAQTQAQLVKDLLDVSMIVSGKMRLESKLLELREPILDAIESLSLAAKAKKIAVRTHFVESDCVIHGDPTRIQQILWNLLSNAVKFTELGGSIDIFLKGDDLRCQIEVKDSGIGIDPAFLPYVFDRFRQEESNTNRRFGGLGLGLGIVRHLVELHGGSVQAQSSGRGNGSTFHIELPRAPLRIVAEKRPAKFPVHTSSSTGKLNGVRVLLIDDEADVRSLIGSILSKEGLIVETADGATRALTLMQSFSPQIVVSDIGMPETDGFDLIRAIRGQELKHGGFTPAIALTAYADSEVANRVLASGFQSYLVKPTSVEAILVEVRRLLEWKS